MSSSRRLACLNGLTNSNCDDVGDDGGVDCDDGGDGDDGVGAAAATRQALGKVTPRMTSWGSMATLRYLDVACFGMQYV